MARLLLRGGRLEETLPAVGERLARAFDAAERVDRRPGRGRHVPAAGGPAPDRDAHRGRAGAGAAADPDADRPGAGGAAGGRAGARRADGRRGRDRRAAPQRRDQDRAAAVGLARPALAADGDPGLRRGAAARPGRARSSWPTTITEEATRPQPPDRQPARPLAPRGRRRRDAPRVVLDRGGARPRPSSTSPTAQFKLAIDDDLPPVRADAAQLERAFANLLENAQRHSGGHPVSVRARDVGGRILVRVVDRGPGIPKAQQERIFEPFYRSGLARPPRLRARAGDRARVRRGQRRPRVGRVAARPGDVVRGRATGAGDACAAGIGAAGRRAWSCPRAGSRRG